MCQSFQVTNNVICQRHSCLFFSCYILFYKRNPLVDLKLKLWPAIHARRGILNVADRSVASFTPSHYLQHYLSMTANAAAVPGLVINATTEYLTNNSRILKRHLNFMVDPPGSKHTHTARSKKKRGISLVLRVFLLPIQPLGNEVREEDRRDCMKGHDRVIDPKYDQHPAGNLVITSNFVHCRRRPTVSLPLMRWFPNKQMKSVRFLADKFSHKVCYKSNSVLACCPVSYLGQKMLG